MEGGHLHVRNVVQMKKYNYEIMTFQSQLYRAMHSRQAECLAL